MAPLIALEEHFDTSLFPSDALHENLPSHLTERLHDLGEGRIKNLDAGKTSLQVLSHIGCWTPVKECVESNDRLAAACRQYPDRFAGFAQLPMQDPQAAVKELERTVRELRFVGALLNNHTEDGSMYDDQKFWPVFERAVELDVPIYIHPTYPAENMERHYKGSFSPGAAIMMSTAGWGWHSETGLHILRLFASGLFDKYPKLKIVIGHMGELLPYMLDRIIHSSRNWGKFERDLRTVWRENIWVTSSGMFTLPPLECLLKMSSADHVMFSVDYPFSSTETGLQFVEEIEKSGLFNKEQFEGFCHGNAEKLLKVDIAGK
ncbi:uncharacterized protein LTR77_011115 [Saxophila tyrrhenica]|uniref:Amidohydrolase-related domain-containing protein n=1 Tax=Saxophila tyrrhenica TaxID=1690608 RepID=A0AAV9NWS7_9PEZI|nr:hypothetical protein LTR77_011115 [Saxophila tyrrhenica]